MFLVNQQFNIVLLVGKKVENHSYTSKFDKIEKFEKADEAFRIAIQLNESGEYVAEVKRICIALEDEYYFI